MIHASLVHYYCYYLAFIVNTIISLAYDDIAFNFGMIVSIERLSIGSDFDHFRSVLQHSHLIL